MQVGRTQALTEVNRNSESLFLLKRSDSSSTCGSVSVNFTPIPLNLSQTTALDVEKDAVKSFPIFNTDRRFFTPCFILEVDKNRYNDNEETYYALHEKRMEELCEEKIIMYVPKPSKNIKFCCICKIFYEDYLAHVTHPQHQLILTNSEFTNQISKLCSLFQEKQEKVNPKNKEKSNKQSDKQKRIKKASLIKTKKQKLPRKKSSKAPKP